MRSGRVILACPVLEIQCLVMLLDHASRYVEHHDLVTTALTAVSAALGYATRAAYIKIIAWPLLHSWLGKGLTLQQLLDVKVFPNY
jgi:hypothetical protein